MDGQTVGWVDVGTSPRVWRRFVGYHESTENSRKKVFGQQISCGKVMEYIGHPVHIGKFFSFKI
jgi:hypothetical protein